MSDHVRLSPSRCPHCGHRLNAASRLSGPVPKPVPGDMTICFGCGEALQFDRRLRLTKITAAEIAALDPDERAELQQTQAAVRSFLAAEGKAP
jgi:hypothetical protein